MNIVEIKIKTWKHRTYSKIFKVAIIIPSLNRYSILAIKGFPIPMGGIKWNVGTARMLKNTDLLKIFHAIGESYSNCRAKWFGRRFCR